MRAGHPQAFGNGQRFEDRGGLELATQAKLDNAIRRQPVD